MSSDVQPCWPTLPLWLYYLINYYRNWTRFDMLAIWIAIAWTTLLDSRHCNPVPTPGTAVVGMIPLADPQRRITDFWSPQGTSRKGEGYCGTISTVGADDWISNFCQSSAKHGQPPPMSNRSSHPSGTAYSCQQKKLQASLPTCLVPWSFSLPWATHDPS